MALSIGTGSAGVITAQGTATATTASFSPPANALLVALVTGNTTSAVDLTINTPTNTGTAMTVGWARQCRKELNAASDGGAGQGGTCAEIWTATTSGTPGAITVSAAQSISGGSSVGLFVLAFTDDGGSVPTLGNKTNASSASGTPTLTVASCTAGSYVVAVAADWAALGAGTYTGLTSVYDAIDVANDYRVHMWRTTSTVSAGSVNMSLAGPAGENYNAVALEIKAVATATVIPDLIMAPMRAS